MHPQGPDRRQQYLDLQQENRHLTAVMADMERQLAEMNSNLMTMERVSRAKLVIPCSMVDVHYVLEELASGPHKHCEVDVVW